MSEQEKLTEEQETQLANAHSEITRAKQAELLLNNELYKAAWDTLNESINNAFDHCSVENTNQLVMIKQYKIVSKDFRRLLEEHITTGKMAIDVVLQLTETIKGRS